MHLFKYKIIIGFYLLLLIANIALFTYNNPAEFIRTHYHVKDLDAHIIALSLIIPYIIEVSFAVIAYLSIRVYTEALGDSKERASFEDFKRGQFYIALTVCIGPLLSGVITYAENSHSTYTLYAAILARYIDLAVLIYAAFLLYRASSRLLNFIHYDGRRLFFVTMILYISFTIVFAVLGTKYIHRGFAQQQSLLTLVYPVNIDSSGLLRLFTTVVPRLVTWFLLGLAVQNFALFQKHVNGTLYKTTFRTIAYGIFVIVAGVILLRTIELLPAAYLASSPMPSLLISYLLGSIGIVGFGLYAFGVSKLYAIEQA